MRRFNLTEIDRRSGCREIQVEGEFDLAVADQFQACLDRVDPEHVLVLVNMEQCEFIDSTGIALILRAHNRLAEQGRRVVIHGASDQVLRILSATGLTSNGLVMANAQEALLDGHSLEH
ncbi:MAG TPA: STAS domain-containing protein [Solirubrobacterales bacterium]|nr:STAS domain-containing protein [Solirubrobacterales bacterium]